MHQLATLHVECRFEPRTLDAKRIASLLDLMQSLTGNDGPWDVTSMRTFSDSAEVRGGAALTALMDVVETRHFLSFVSRFDASGRWELVRLTRYHGAPQLRIDVQLDVEVSRRDIALAAIGEIFGSHAISDIHVLGDAVGMQWSIIEMALQRNFTMFHFDKESEEVEAAKAMAHRLPRLRASQDRTDGFPIRIGWLNYWPAHVAAKLGFPNADLDAEWLSGSRQLPSGAWIVKLTPEPLDLTRLDHAETLARAYWRFSDIGERMHPVAAKKRRPVRPAGKLASAGELKTFVVRERDEDGQWWQAEYEPIRARNEKEALKTLFAKYARSRKPRPRDTLAGLRSAYDEIASEVGLKMSADIDVVEVQDGAVPVQADNEFD